MNREEPKPLNAGITIRKSPELERLRQLVFDARAQLAQLQTDYTREKSRADSIQTIFFRRLREHYQKRDKLRILIEYRRKLLDSLMNGTEQEVKEVEVKYEEASAQSERDYEEKQSVVAEQKQLTSDEEAELMGLWKKLVKLYHPDRFANEPDKLETYAKLTSAINRAKDSGDIETLRRIAQDPHGFILRRGWSSLDFSDKEELTQLQRLNEALEREIITVTESLRQLRKSSDYELWRVSDENPGLLDELVAQRANLLETESAALEAHADLLQSEIDALDWKKQETDTSTSHR